ncbi:hypothetical protein Leryth_008864 [Lithospermum erythrorhizon]|nr:hypothetical protein Leryth_008864 [Lithospermum erythrorhizon]
MSNKRGEMLYKIYKAVTYSITPLVWVHLRWRKFRRLEHPLRWPERLGRPSQQRPPGPLFWFHAVSLGEGLAALPVIECCVDRRPDVTVLMTTTTLSAFQVIKNMLPSNVIYQFAPLDIPTAVDAFLSYWKPNAIVLMESELWPNLIMCAVTKRISLALINARMSERSLCNWSQPVSLPLASLILSKFSLILPLSTTQGIRFQLLQAPPYVINFSGDLKYAVGNYSIVGGVKNNLENLGMQLSDRRVWMASSIHKGEETVILGVHKKLKKKFPDIVTIIVPRHPQFGQEIALKLQKEGVNVALRSRHDRLVAGIDIYVVDTLGELRVFYGLTPIAVIGGSFLPESAGHNISEAAAAGCAVLTGYHIGHFSCMVQRMKQLNPLSIMQVSGDQLFVALSKLFSDARLLEACRMAAKQAYCSLSSGVIDNVMHQLEIHVFHQYSTKIK